MKIRRSKRSKNYFLDTYINHRRVRISLGTSDKHIARAAARKYEADMVDQMPVHPANVTKFLDDYYKWSETRKTKSTIESDRQRLNRLFAFAPVQSLDQLTTYTAEHFLASLMQGKKPLKPASVNSYLRVLRSVFGTAKRWNFIKENPFSNISLLRYEPELPRILSRDEIRAFFKSCAAIKPQFVPLFAFSLLTGLRRGEIIDLEWENVLFEKNVIIAKRTKGKRPRVIPMLSRTKKILLARKGNVKPFDEDRDYVSQIFKKVCKAAGFADASMHDLRRSFATYLKEAGMDSYFIQMLLGHQDFSTTDTFYLNTSTDLMKKQMRPLERLLN